MKIFIMRTFRRGGSDYSTSYFHTKLPNMTKISKTATSHYDCWEADEMTWDSQQTASSEFQTESSELSADVPHQSHNSVMSTTACADSAPSIARNFPAISIIGIPTEHLIIEQFRKKWEWVLTSISLPLSERLHKGRDMGRIWGLGRGTVAGYAPPFTRIHLEDQRILISTVFLS